MATSRRMLVETLESRWMLFSFDGVTTTLPDEVGTLCTAVEATIVDDIVTRPADEGVGQSSPIGPYQTGTCQIQVIRSDRSLPTEQDPSASQTGSQVVGVGNGAEEVVSANQTEARFVVAAGLTTENALANRSDDQPSLTRSSVQSTNTDGELPVVTIRLQRRAATKPADAVGDDTGAASNVDPVDNTTPTDGSDDQAASQHNGNTNDVDVTELTPDVTVGQASEDSLPDETAQRQLRDVRNPAVESEQVADGDAITNDVHADTQASQQSETLSGDDAVTASGLFQRRLWIASLADGDDVNDVESGMDTSADESVTDTDPVAEMFTFRRGLQLGTRQVPESDTTDSSIGRSWFEVVDDVWSDPGTVDSSDTTVVPAVNWRNMRIVGMLR
jgi:hypothetical protein